MRQKIRLGRTQSDVHLMHLNIGVVQVSSEAGATAAGVNGCGVWLPDWLPIGPAAYEGVQNVLTRSD
jgi:hypothetical protein